MFSSEFYSQYRCFILLQTFRERTRLINYSQVEWIFTYILRVFLICRILYRLLREICSSFVYVCAYSIRYEGLHMGQYYLQPQTCSSSRRPKNTELCLPKTAPILIAVCYRPRTQSNFYTLLEQSCELWTCRMYYDWWLQYKIQIFFKFITKQILRFLGTCYSTCPSVSA